jgi:two-component system OmpR family sensor kinase
MGGTMYAARAATELADFYARADSWRGVEPYLADLRRVPEDRLLVADRGGAVVADTAGQAQGRRAAELGLSEGTAISVGGQQIGSLYVLGDPSTRSGMMGPGMMMGRGNPRATGTQVDAGQTVATPEESFLAAVNRGLLFGALGAGVLAVALSLLLTRQVVRPLSALAASSRRLAAGDLAHRVEVKSRDEFGDVARAFNAMAESLERDEVARRHLLADVAHELRTPLTVIEGTADGILDGVLEPNPEQIGIIKEEAGLLAKLVADLRDLSLAEAGQLRLDRQPQDLAEVVGRAVRGFEPEARRRGQTLELVVDGPLPPVPVDADRLAQAIGNLVSNAVRHTPSGGRISVSVGRDPADARRALVQVADSGEGIAAEDLPHVFERFYRADKSRSRRSGGSGLGLAIVKQMVEAHGGQVWAQSEQGRGSSFSIALPVD